MESADKRSSHPENSKRMGDPFVRKPNPRETPQGDSDERDRSSSHGNGSEKHAGKGSHTRGNTQGGPICKQRLRDPKRGGGIQTHNKPERIKQFPEQFFLVNLLQK